MAQRKTESSRQSTEQLLSDMEDILNPSLVKFMAQEAASGAELVSQRANRSRKEASNARTITKIDSQSKTTEGKKQSSNIPPAHSGLESDMLALDLLKLQLDDQIDQKVYSIAAEMPIDSPRGLRSYVARLAEELGSSKFSSLKGSVNVRTVREAELTPQLIVTAITFCAGIRILAHITMENSATRLIQSWFNFLVKDTHPESLHIGLDELRVLVTMLQVYKSAYLDYLKKNPDSPTPISELPEAGEIVHQMDVDAPNPSKLFDKEGEIIVISLTELEKQLLNRDWDTMKQQFTDVIRKPVSDTLELMFEIGFDTEPIIMGKNCFLHALRFDSAELDINWMKRQISVYEPATIIPNNMVELYAKTPLTQPSMLLLLF